MGIFAQGLAKPTEMNKSSAVPKMGNRGHMGRKEGDAVPLSRGSWDEVLT